MDDPGAEELVEAVVSLSPFNKLPEELVQHIFNYFEIEDKRTARLVNKNWKTAINSRLDVTFRIVLSNETATCVQGLISERARINIDCLRVEDFDKLDFNIEMILPFRMLIFGPYIHLKIFMKFLKLFPINQIETLEFYNGCTLDFYAQTEILLPSVRCFKYTITGVPYIASSFHTYIDGDDPAGALIEQTIRKMNAQCYCRTNFHDRVNLFATLVGALVLPSLEVVDIDIQLDPWFNPDQFARFYDFLNKNLTIQSVKVKGCITCDRQAGTLAPIQGKFHDLELSINLANISHFRPLLAIRHQLRHLKLIEVNVRERDLEGQPIWRNSNRCLTDLVLQNSSCLETLYLKLHLISWTNLDLTNFPCLTKAEIHLDFFRNLAEHVKIPNLKSLTLCLNPSYEPPESARINFEKLREWVLASSVGLEELTFPYIEEFGVEELRWVLTKSRIKKILLNQAEQDLIQEIIEYCALTPGIQGSWVRSGDNNGGSNIDVANNYVILVDRNEYWDPLE